MARNSRLTRILLTATVAAPLFGGAVATPAYAADASCAEPIIDEMNVLGDDRALVEDAIAELESTGADVRVRTFDSYAPFSSLDEKLRDIRTECDGNWSLDNGETMKGNLIVYALTTKPENAQQFFYGSNWENVLGRGRSIEIQTDPMAPYLGAGEFAEGIAAGLKTVTNDINEGRSGGDTIVNEAADLSGLWSILGTALMAFAAIIGLVLLVVGGRRGHAYSNQLKQAKIAANEAKDESNSLYLKIHENGEKEFQDFSLETIKSASPVFASKANAQATIYDSNTRNATMLLREADEDFRNPTFLEKHSVEWHRNKEEAYQAIVRCASAALAARGAIKKLEDEVEAEVKKIPQLISNSDSRINALEDAVRELKENGFMTGNLEAMIEEAKQDAKIVSQLPCTVSTLDELHDLQVRIGGVDTAIRDYTSEIARCKQSEAQLRESLATARTRVEEADAALSRMKSEFSSGNWKDVASNVDSAHQLLSDAHNRLDDGAAKAGMDYQQWGAAIRLFADAANNVTSGTALLNEVTKREQTLESIRANASKDVASVDDSIRNMQIFNDQHVRDIARSVDNLIREATTNFESAQNELAKDQPNYLQVAQYVRRAGDTIRTAHHDAARQVEAAETARRNAQQAVEKAEKAINTANEYFQRNRSDVEYMAKRKLEEAQSELKNAKRSDDPASTTRLATKAKSSAEDALRKAKNDVSDAERSRRSSSNSSYGTAAGMGIGMGIGSSGGIGGGGGSSSSFSSGDGGGGGSSSSF